MVVLDRRRIFGSGALDRIKRECNRDQCRSAPAEAGGYGGVGLRRRLGGGREEFWDFLADGHYWRWRLFG